MTKKLRNWGVLKKIQHWYRSNMKQSYTAMRTYYNISENNFRTKIEIVLPSEGAAQKCSLDKVFWKYAANLQEKTQAEVLCQ